MIPRLEIRTGAYFNRDLYRMRTFLHESPHDLHVHRISFVQITDVQITDRDVIDAESDDAKLKLLMYRYNKIVNVILGV